MSNVRHERSIEPHVLVPALCSVSGPQIVALVVVGS